jgi:hypothetical protein
MPLERLEESNRFGGEVDRSGPLALRRDEHRRLATGEQLLPDDDPTFGQVHIRPHQAS